MSSAINSIKNQYILLVKNSKRAIILCISAILFYKILGLTPDTVINPGSTLDHIVWFLEKRSGIFSIIIIIFSAIVVCFTWWIGEKINIFRGYWRIPAKHGLIFTYNIATIAAAIIIVIYKLGLTPALSTAQELLESLIPFGFICVFVPLAAGIWLAPPDK